MAGGVGRDHTAADRAGAASDRRLAAEDRASASADSGHARLELEQAHHDSLTGAQRRNRGRMSLQHEIERSRRSDEPFALAFIDVDGLKELNDRAGHAAGDALLQTVVVALKAELRSSDRIVRHGGDGFTNTDLETSRRRVEQIRAGLAKGSTKASISVGIATLGERDPRDAHRQSRRRHVVPERTATVRCVNWPFGCTTCRDRAAWRHMIGKQAPRSRRRDIRLGRPGAHDGGDGPCRFLVIAITWASSTAWPPLVRCGSPIDTTASEESQQPASPRRRGCRSVRIARADTSSR
jgi:diguanylate cyclase (GGDEF)-like protein